MFTRFAHRFCFTLIAVLCLTGSQCSPQTPADAHPAAPATAINPGQGNAETWSTAPQCNGGNRVSANPSSSDLNMAADMVTAIRNWRVNVHSPALSPLYGRPANAATTVAFYHAEDMNGNSYVNLIASDGENVTQHLACMDGPIMNGGAIVVGQSDSVTDVLNYLTQNASTLSVLTLNGSRLVVGYSNGYWCLLIY